jgi:hypothetical protein
MWVAVVAALAGGFALFLFGTAGHVAPFYPRNFDQLSEYVGLYRTHYALVDTTLTPAARLEPAALVLLDLRGWAVPWIATAFGFAFGANRLAFASTNYVFFAAIVVALAGAMRRRCDAWTAGTAVGLMLLSRSVFLVTGGVHDLRMDFVGLAMFGIFVLALWRMAETPDHRSIALAVLAYAVSLWSRSITGVYGLVAIATFGAIALAMMALGRDPAWRARWRAALALGLIAGPIFALFVALHYRAIDSYYFNLLRSEEIRIRLAEFNLTSRAELLGFYLRSAWLHFRPLVLWFAVTLGLAAASWAVAWRRGGLRPHAAPAAYGPAWTALGAATIGVLLPLSVFSTSSVVIGILTVPLAAAGAFVIAVARSALPPEATPWKWLARAIALLPLAAGAWICARAFIVPPVWGAADIPMAQAHNALFEAVAADGGGTIAWMTVSEGANAAGFSVYLYESGRAAAVGTFRNTETAIFAMDADAARARIAEAEGVVIWHRFPAQYPYPQYPYPAVTSLRDTQALWQPILDREFALRTELAMPDGTIAYYRRVGPRGSARATPANTRDLRPDRAPDLRLSDAGRNWRYPLPEGGVRRAAARARGLRLAHSCLDSPGRQAAPEQGVAAAGI